MTQGRLKDKVALVTGGASGIGEATVRLFHAEGARVAIGDIDRERARALAAELGDGAIELPLDVRAEDSWIQTIEEVERTFGALHVLVQSAGISRPGTIEEIDLAEWRDHQLTNAEGAFLGCKYAIPAMKRSGYGSIINISSIESIRTGAMLCAYGASKAALDNLTKTVALHCAESGYNIRCNSVHPAAIDTPMLQEYLDAAEDPDGLRAYFASCHAIKRIGTAEEVALANLFLASEESRFTTGAAFPVDGGSLIKPY